MKSLSIIIPFYESISVLREYLPGVLKKVKNKEQIELILADATASAEVESYCQKLDVSYLPCPEKGRALQMNNGAYSAKGVWLFFLHIDSIPPSGFDELITNLKREESGCFRLKFDWNHWFLKFFSHFTRFYWLVARGGDQGLFVKRDVFLHLNGFREIPIMEDIDMCRRLMKRKTFVILHQRITTSARKYRQYGVYRLQLIFGWITLLYWLGVEENTLKRIYDKNIR